LARFYKRHNIKLELPKWIKKVYKKK
jgi:hypothetical protein